SEAPARNEPVNSHWPAYRAKDDNRSCRSALRMQAQAQRPQRRASSTWHSERFPNRPWTKMIAADRWHTRGSGGEAGFRYSQFAAEWGPKANGKSGGFFLPPAKHGRGLTPTQKTLAPPTRDFASLLAGLN